MAVLNGLYSQWRSLHDVAANIEEYSRVVATAGQAAPARSAKLARMNEEVQALLLKYPQAQQAESEGPSAEGPSAEGPMGPPPAKKAKTAAEDVQDVLAQLD